jgi:exodeoxyribonuclease VII large subunit
MLRQRQQEALRCLLLAWRRQLERRHARLRHADAVLRTMQPRRRLVRLHERLEPLRSRAQAALARRLQRDAMHLRGLVRSLHAVSPLATVARGYAILQHDDGRIVRSVGDAATGDSLDARLVDGRLRVRVEKSGP